MAQRDKTIQEMVAEKDATHESLHAKLRQQLASAEKFKEENWSLEVHIQDLGAQLQDTQQAAARAESEAKRAAKRLGETQEMLESQKNDTERASVALQDMRSKHETDLAHLRRQAETLNRDKTDLQVSLDTLKWDTAKRERYIRNRSGNSIDGVKPPAEVSTPNTRVTDSDPFNGPTSQKRLGTPAFLIPGIPFGHGLDSSPDSSPSRPTIDLPLNNQSNDLKALQLALEDARQEMTRLKATNQQGELVVMEEERANSNLRITLDNEIRDANLQRAHKTVGLRARGLHPSKGRRSSGKVLVRAMTRATGATSSKTRRLMLLKIIATLAGTSGIFFFLYLVRCQQTETEYTDWT